MLHAAPPCNEHPWAWALFAWPKSPFQVCCKEDGLFPRRLVALRTGEAVLHSALISVAGAFFEAMQTQSHIAQPLWPYCIAGKELSFKWQVYVQPRSLAPVPKLFTRARHSDFHPGWIHEEWSSSFRAKVNLCSFWERTHSEVKVKEHIYGLIVSDFLKFCFPESSFSFFPSLLLPCWPAQETKQSVGTEMFARLKKTPFTLANDGLHLFSIPIMCL